MQSLVDPFAGDDRLPPCLDSLAFAGDDAEAGDDATAAPAEADPGRRAGRRGRFDALAGGGARNALAGIAGERGAGRRSRRAPSVVAPSLVAPSPPAFATPSATPSPSARRGARGSPAAAASPRDAASPAPPSPDAAPAPGAADSSPVLPARRRRASSPGSASRRVPTDESESPAATLLLSPASTFLRTLGHPDDDTTAPGDGASDGGPGGGAPGTEEPSADSAELAELARADTPEDSLSTAPDFASETASSATPPPRGSPLRRRRGAVEPTRRNRFKERAPFVAAAGGLTLAPGVDVASPKDAPPKLSAVERYLERLRRDALDDSDDSADGGDDAPSARRPSRQLPTFRGHAIFAARDQGRPVPANGPAVPKLLETEDVVLPRNLTRLEKFRAGLPVDAAPARAAAAAVRVDDVAVEPAILRLRELPWAARIGRPADPPKRPRDIFGRLRLPAPVVDASAESEATPRDPRVDQILKEQDRYAYVLRTYIKYL
ncbi:serine/threonine kinase [Aureococcus anophagefferens]|nr:serine/threonine kinase [Aureococcus anophagefferens]